VTAWGRIEGARLLVVAAEQCTASRGVFAELAVALLGGSDGIVAVTAAALRNPTPDMRASFVTSDGCFLDDVTTFINTIERRVGELRVTGAGEDEIDSESAEEAEHGGSDEVSMPPSEGTEARETGGTAAAAGPSGHGQSLGEVGDTAFGATCSKRAAEQPPAAIGGQVSEVEV